MSLVNRGKKVETKMAGFCVDKGGLIVTCGHNLKSLSGINIEGCRLDDRTLFTLDIIDAKWKWNMCLLRVQVEGVEFNRVDMSTDGLNIGELILHIGYGDEFVGSWNEGRVAFKCPNYAAPEDGAKTCKKYE